MSNLYNSTQASRLMAQSSSLISDQEFAKSICLNLHNLYNVDLDAIFSSEGLTDKQKIKMGANRLQEAIFLRAYNNGYEGFDLNLSEGGTIIANGDIDIEPNIALSEADAKFLSTLEKEEVKTYLFNLTKRFENMANAKTPGLLVAEMAAGGIIAVGVPMAVTVVKGLIAKQALKTAMLAGIKGIGMKTVIGAVVIVLATLIFYLLVENPKKILGMVINNTDDNLVVNKYRESNGNLFMQHGQMVDFMEDNEDGLQSPKLQIKQRLNFGENNEDNVVFAGIYFADRNIGFRGSEGVMVFTSTTTSLQFAHMFAVPYTNDNRTNMRYLAQTPSSLEVLFRELYNENKVRVDFISNGYRMTSTVNDPRGGVVGCIAYVAIT